MPVHDDGRWGWGLGRADHGGVRGGHELAPVARCGRGQQVVPTRLLSRAATTEISGPAGPRRRDSSVAIANGFVSPSAQDRDRSSPPSTGRTSVGTKTPGVHGRQPARAPTDVDGGLLKS